MTDPANKDLEQRTLAKVNQTESWLKGYWPWIIAGLAVLVAGFIFGKLA